MVYVDDPIWPLGRMIMCHMLADSKEELLAMVDRIGVQRKWIQNEGTPTEHFDVCRSKRSLAIQCGAKAITRKEFVEIVREKRRKFLTCD